MPGFRILGHIHTQLSTNKTLLCCLEYWGSHLLTGPRWLPSLPILKASPDHEPYSKVNFVCTGSVFVIRKSYKYTCTPQFSLADASYDIMHYSIELFISIITVPMINFAQTFLPITMISSGFNQLCFHLQLHTMQQQFYILICKHQALQIVCCAYILTIHSVMIQY